jgi:hypothetical protein
MDEKTAELRDIFIDVTDDDSVTEKQEEPRGSLAEDETEIEGKLRTAIEQMRAQLAFETDLSLDGLIQVVRGFYDDKSDESIADTLDLDRETVAQARHDLHLIRERERDVPFDTDDFQELLAEEYTPAEIADELALNESTAQMYYRVVETQEEIRRVNSRYTNEFEELLTDADLEDHTEDVTEDGLDEATEGMETDVSF